MRNVKFGTQVSLGFIGKLLSMAVAFGGSIILARFVGPSIFGEYFLLLSIIMLLDNPATGWAQAARKRMTEKDFANAEAVGGAFLLPLAMIPIAAVSGPIANWLNITSLSEKASFLIPLMFLASVSYTVFLEALKGTANFGGVQWIHALRDILRVVIQVGLVVAGYSLAGMATGFAVATVFVLPVIYRLTEVFPAVPSRESIRSIWQYARHSIPRRVVGTALGRMDIILLGILATTAASGHYQAALNITLPATFLTTVAAPGMMSRISALDSHEEYSEATVHVQRAVNYSSIIAIPLVVGATIVGTHTVILIYGTQYSEAGLYVAGLAMFQLLKSQTSIYTSVIEGLDRPDLTLRYSIVQFIVNIGLGVALLLAIGLFGVVIATVVAKSIHYFMTTRAVVQRLEVSPIGSPVKYQLQVALVMGIAVSIASLWVSPTDTFRVAGLISLGAIVYGGGILLSEEHRKLVFGIFKQLRQSTI